MVRAHILRLLLATLALASVVSPARALQLGESKAQIEEKHGAPGAEDRGKNVAIYFWEGWSAELEFKEEAVSKLVYRRNSYLEQAEIVSLLQSNGGSVRWRETSQAVDQTRQWVRDDGAIATCLRVRPLMMTFQAGQRKAPSVARYGAQPTPRITTSAPAEIVSTTPPRFPKLLGSGVDSEPESASPGSSTAVPLRPMRTLPKLPSEEINAGGTAEVTNPALPPVAAPSESRAARRAASGPEGELPPAEPVPYNVSSDGYGFVIWLLVLLGLLGGVGFYWYKTRGPTTRAGTGPFIREVTPSAATPRPEPVSNYKSIPAPANLSTNPAIDALRSDQYDLLIGEIFRREGYAVEISAAAAQGDSIDLTLRRDSETILVQCKHWKTSRVTERELAEFHQAMMANGAPRGIFVTAGTFSREAQQFAAGKEIDLMDRAALEECTAAVARRGENFCAITPWIEEFTSHSRIFDPECPICHGSMSVRPNRATGAAAWTCRNHPRCPGKREARLDLIPASSAH